TFSRQGTSTTLSFGVFRGTTKVTEINAANAIDVGVWHHYAVTMTPAGVVTLYRDGVALPTTNGIGGTPQLPNPNVTRAQNYIGKSDWTQDADFAGSIDEVAIFDKALSSTQI